MKKSKVYFNTGIVLFISILLIWYFLKDNYKISIEVLRSANVFWLFFAVLFFLGYFLLETLLMKILINKHKKSYTYKSALKLYLMTKFFNGITPFSSGGQPLQLLEMKKEGVSYTFLTVDELKKTHENLFLVMGTDNIEGLHGWKNVDEMLDKCTVYFVPRPGFPITESDKKELISLDCRYETADFIGADGSSTLVPVANARPQPTRKMIAGRKLNRLPAAVSTRS